MPTYPPHPMIAAKLGVPGNEACTCPTPLQAMLCPHGHMLECHAGLTCAEAQCGHWERDNALPPSDITGSASV